MSSRQTPRYTRAIPFTSVIQYPRKVNTPISSIFTHKTTDVIVLISRSSSVYHYGLTIKEYREARHWTQAQLANVWPKSNGDIGVSTDYVSLVETGKRQIEDI